jgi:hypothetical protein
VRAGLLPRRPLPCMNVRLAALRPACP